MEGGAAQGSGGQRPGGQAACLLPSLPVRRAGGASAVWGGGRSRYATAAAPTTRRGTTTRSAFRSTPMRVTAAVVGHEPED